MSFNLGNDYLQAHTESVDNWLLRPLSDSSGITVPDCSSTPLFGSDIQISTFPNTTSLLANLQFKDSSSNFNNDFMFSSTTSLMPILGSDFNLFDSSLFAMPKLNIPNWDSFLGDSTLSTLKPKIGEGYNLKLSNYNEKELAKIKDIFAKNRAKYETVSKATGVPAELICAIHYREGGCNFTTYLHNGDPLGKPTVHVPKGKLFYDWTEAAIDAIKSNSYYKKVSRGDFSSQIEYAERYNGLGYRNKGVKSPYVWAATDQYSDGMYVKDGVYSSDAKDKRVGVVAIMDALYT